MTTQEQAEHEKIMATIANLNANTEKMSKESSYYPIIVGATLALAVVAVVKMFL